jgi:hypothetical protein
MRFSGSDRQARGRAIRCVLDGITTSIEITEAMHLSQDNERAERLLNDLVGEGLLVRRGDHFNVP